MMSSHLVCVFYLLLLALIGCNGLITSGDGAEDDIHVKEVEIGANHELKCGCNDDDHRFQFWVINNNFVIGPNSYLYVDANKYKGDMLNGKLLIRNITVKEQGIYTCLCKHMDSRSYHVRSTELVVKRDWEQVYDNDKKTNTFRMMLLLGMMLFLGFLIFILLTLRNNRLVFLKGACFRVCSHIISYLDVSEPLNLDEEKAGTSYERLRSSSTQYGDHRASVSTYDNVPLDRGFPKEFQTNSSMQHV